MIKPISLIVDVLRNNVSVSGKPVKLVKQASPVDQTPCMSIDDSGGAVVLQKHITNRYHDGASVLRERKNATLQINVWCNSERERESITTQVQTLFYMMQSDHYKFCQNTSCDCVIPASDKRGSKNQCPKPDELGYKNLFTKYDIIRNTFNVEPPFSLDDRTLQQPVLRSIFKVSMTYYTDYIIGGNTINELYFDEELL